MWPFNKQRMDTRDSEEAVEAAKQNLHESRKDRQDVRMLKNAMETMMSENHISVRIAMLLKEE